MPEPTDIRKHDIRSMGIASYGFDYSPLEKILAGIGPRLTVPHRHDYYEIIWFTHCRGKHMVEFVSYDLIPNMLFVFSRNQIHAFINIKGLKGHVLRFSKAFLKRLPENYTAGLNHTLFKMHASPVRIISEENAFSLSAIINLIKGEFRRPGRHLHESMLAVLLHAFLIETERLTPQVSTISGERRTLLKTFYKFNALLERYYSKQYRVEQYAELLGMSAKRLGEICKQAAGMPPKRIIEEHVGLEAKRLLRHSDLSVKQISYRLGFDDPAYFSRFFKRTASMSPSAFRFKDSEMYQTK